MTAEDEKLDPEGILVVTGEELTPDAEGDVEVAAMVDRLRADPRLDAAARTDPVTDAVKRVGPDGMVRATIDRSRLVSLRPPMAVRRTAWEADRIDVIGPM